MALFYTIFSAFTAAGPLPTPNKKAEPLLALLGQAASIGNKTHREFVESKKTLGT
jgi:hypothetical protein